MTAKVNNPMIRVCLMEAGQFWVPQTQGEELPLCYFDAAGVGAEAFYLYKTNQKMPQSVRAYLSYHVYAEEKEICTQVGADKLLASSPTQSQVAICRFQDGSLIEASTLHFGFGHSRNQNLDKALSTTY